MTITRIPAIQSGGTWYELYPTVKVTRGLIFSSSFRTIEFADIAAGAAGLVETHGQAYGQEINVSGQENFDDLASAKAFEEALEALLLDDAGKPRVVEFCEWVGTKGVFRSCVLAGAIRWPEVRTLKRFKYDFTLRSPYPVRFDTATDGSVPTSSTYAAFHAGSSYDPYGVSIIPTGALVVVNRTRSQITVMFPTIVDELTGASAENVGRLQRRVVLSASLAMTIRALYVRSATAALSGGGSTRVKVANVAYDGSPAQVIAATMAAADTYAAPVTGTVAAAAGVPVYVWFDLAGNHSDVEVVLEVEPS